MNNFKRFLSLALAVLMTLSYAPTIAYATDFDSAIDLETVEEVVPAEDEVVDTSPDSVIGSDSINEEGGTEAEAEAEVQDDADTETLVFTVVNGAAQLTDGKSASGDVVIPETVTIDGVEYTVTTIAANAFNDANEVTSVVVPNSVTTLGDAAFANMDKLKSITIGNGVTSWGSKLAVNNYELETVVIAEGATLIGDIAFRTCPKLANVTLPSTLKSIGATAFTYSAITELNIPASVEKIGADAFKDIDTLKKVTFNSVPTSFGTTVFQMCDGLEEVVLPEGLTSIPQGTFRYCTSLKTINFPESLTEIGNYSFQGCTSLESVTISRNITNLVTNAFNGCTSLKNLTIEEGFAGTIGAYAFQGCTALESVVIPSSMETVGESMFNGCTSLKNVTLSEGVKTLNISAFANCTALETLTLPDSLERMRHGSIANCTALKELIILGDNLPVIENSNALEGLSEDIAVVYNGDDEFTGNWSAVAENVFAEIDLKYGPYTIETAGQYIVRAYDGANTLTIKADATVELQGVNITAAEGVSAISIESGNVTLNVAADGTLTGGKGGAGIYVAEGASLTVTGGKLTAIGNGGEDTSDSGAAGIGGTYANGNSGAITINGATVVAKGYGVHGSGIGSGSGKVVGEINIVNGAKVTAQGGYYANGAGTELQSSYGKSDPEGGAAIGGGGKTASTIANITITDSTVTAYGGSKAAGIGANFWSSCGTITISGDKSNVTAQGGSSSAGIGTSRAGDTGVSSNIVISGGTVTATGGAYGAGIGAGYNADSLGNGADTSALPETSITIFGGTVIATGGEGGAGIGGGYKTDNVDIDITGGNVTASAGKLVSGKTVENGGAAAAIGTGANGSGVFKNSPAVEIGEDATVTVISYYGGKNAVEGIANDALSTNVSFAYLNLEAVAAVNGKNYYTLAEAIEAAQDGGTITLLTTCDEDVTITQKPGVVIIIDGNGKTYSGTITVDGRSAAYVSAGLTIKNFTFVATDISKDASINLGVKGDNNTRYTSNVTVEDCTFTGTGNAKVAIKSYTGGDKNLTVTRCTASGMHSLAQLPNVSGATFTECTVDGKNGISLGNSSNVTINKCTITATGYGIRADGDSENETDGSATITNCTITAEWPIVVRKATGAYKLTVSGNTLTASNEGGYGVTFTADDDGTTVGPTGEFTLNGGENLNVYPISAYVATVNEKGYLTLAEAVAAANAVEGGATVTLIKDVTLGEKLTISGNVTISGEHTITRADDYTGTLFTVDAGATLTLDGGLVIDGNNNWTLNEELYNKALNLEVSGVTWADLITSEVGKPNAAAPMFKVTGSVVANKVTIQNNYSDKSSNNGDYGVFQIDANATLTMTGATVKHIVTGGANSVAHLSTDSVWTMNGGTLITDTFAGRNGGICRNDSGKFVMNGGTICTNRSINTNGTVIMLYKGSMEMNGGTICHNSGISGTNNGRCAPIYGHSTSTFVMTGGTITENQGIGYGGVDVPSSIKVEISGGHIGDNISSLGLANADVNGNSNTVITGGTFTQDVSAWLAPDCGLVYDEETGTYGLTEDLYEYNGTAYKTLADVIKAIKDAPTAYSTEAPVVEVIANHKVDETTDVDINLVLDLNGKTITGAAKDGVQVYPVIRVLGDANVIIKDSMDEGGITNNDYVFVLGASDGSSAGNLTIESGTYTGNVTVASVTKGTLTINGGEFSVSESEYGATYLLNCIDANYKDGSAVIEVKGGTFTGFNPADNAAEGTGTNFVADEYEAVPDYENGTYSVCHIIVAKVGDTPYRNIDEAIAAWTNGTTLTLLADVTLSDVITLKSTEYHILNLGTYTMTAADGKNAIVIQACGTGSNEKSALTINADAANPGGINAGKKCVIYYKYADGGISTEDRPIIKINGGVFTGTTSSIGTAGIYTIGTAARKCATLNISGGTFNCSIYGSSKSKLLISGGTFNYSVGSQGDSTAYRLISGGTFKTIGFMTADSNNTKFWFGTSMANSNVGVYVDDNGYLVVGGPVVTEPGTTFEASSTNYSGWSSYLKYSSAAENGLYYTSALEALTDNNKTTGEVTVYVEELDLTDLNYKGTIQITEDTLTLTVTFAEGTTPAWTVASAVEGKVVAYTDSVENGVVSRTYRAIVPVAQIGENYYESLAEAIDAAEAGDHVAILKAGTYSVPAGKDLIITGAVDDVVFDNIGAKNMGGANVTFNNVTFDYYPNVKYTGLQHSGNLVYNNCIFNGQVFLYGASETFNNCTFNQNSADAYNVWTYGAKEVAFNECTFNCAGKSVLIYAEGANISNDVTVTDCDFIASAPVEGKAAIEMDSSLTAGISLTIDSKTTATGFDEGSVSGNSLWNNKKDNKTEANNDITVIVNGETVLKPLPLVAETNSVKYTSLEAAIDAAQADATVTLLDSVELEKILTIDKAITINGNGNTLTSTAGRAINIDCDGTVTIESLTVLGETGCERGINIINKAGTTNLSKVSVSGVSYYAVHVATSAGAAKVNVDGSELTGYAAIAVYGEGSEVTVTGSKLVGINSYEDNGASDFSTIAIGAKNVKVIVTGGSVSAEATKNTAKQFIFGHNSGTSDGSIVVLNTDIIIGGENVGYLNIDADEVTVSVKDAYADKLRTEGWVVKADTENLVTVTSEAVARNTGTSETYATVSEALEKAKSGETVKLITNTTDGYVLVAEGVTLDLGEYALTANYVIVFNNGYITGTTIGTTSYAKLIVAKEGHFISANSTAYKAESYDILPVWNDKENCFVFSAFVIDNDSGEFGIDVDSETGEVTFKFVHKATGWVNKNLLNDGASNNGLSIRVRVEWTLSDGTSTFQDFVYSDKHVAAVASGSSYYKCVLKNYKGIEGMKIYALVLTDCGTVSLGTVYDNLG